MERFDAVVVGAGPAGSVTAYRLARAGARVLLADRARFPRDKPCGGGLTVRAVRELPFSVDPVVEEVVDRMELRLGYAARFERRGRRPLVLMTQRRRLDAYLAERAAAAGADFRDATRVTAIRADAEGVEVTFDGGRAASAVLVGADGANGVVGRSLGLGGDYAYGVALEGNAPHGAASAARHRGRASIELGVIPGGYGWIFPKGDHVNVGVGGWDHQGPHLREHLVRVCREHGIARERLESVRGHRLPLRRARSRPAAGRVLLVGDAAGLVDPLTGDGMFEAFVSARLAAASVLDLLAGRTRDLEGYASALADSLSSGLAASWGAKVALDLYPRLMFSLARAPGVWRVVESLVRGDVPHPRLARGVGRVPLRAVEGLAAAAGDRGAEHPLGAPT